METNIYKEYIKEIEERKGQGLHPKPIDSAESVSYTHLTLPTNVP
jgi:aconitate hydratase 2/2-methylisocitrate dehydratase